MPYMHVRTNVTATAAQKTELKQEMGRAVALLPGKTERWLMVDVEDGATLFLAGDGDRPLAMVEVELFGRSSPAAYDALTAEVCHIMEKTLAVPGDGVYVKYAEVEHWGYDGSNF
jgi:phenylpyruvate tautomerase PptA (4-oxalocrotonate tautomerase family)